MVSSTQQLAGPSRSARLSHSFIRSGLLLAIALLLSLTATAKAQAADCMTAKECLTAAAWQAAIAADYQSKGDWFAAVARQNFVDAKQWGDKATFAFYAGDATAAAWYKAIADDYAKKAVANTKAADDYHARAAFVRAVALNNANRGQFFAVLWDADPLTPEGINVPYAEPSDPKKYNCTGAAKMLPNKRKIHSRGPVHHDLFWYRLEAAWTFCNGKVTKLYPAAVDQDVTDTAAAAGWEYVSRDKVRAECYGPPGTRSDPERCAWSYRWYFVQDNPTVDVGPLHFDTDVHKSVCITTQVKGNGAHLRHGGCDLKPWTGSSWGGGEY